MFPFLRSLDAEWTALGPSPAGRRAMMSWSARHEVMRGLRELDDVLRARLDPERAPGLLAALAAMAPTDQVAARTLLQALVPGLVRLAVTSGNDDPRAIEELVSLAWERIRTYPPTRKGSVAGNVLLDVRKRYRQHRLIEQPTTSSHCAGEPTDGINAPEVELLGRELLSELAKAQRDGVVSAQTMSWIVRTRLLGDSIEEVAAEESLPERTVCQRRWRAERRLRRLPLAG